MLFVDLKQTTTFFSLICVDASKSEKDEVDSNGDPKYQGIDHSMIVPLIVAAVKELITKVESLEAA